MRPRPRIATAASVVSLLMAPGPLVSTAFAANKEQLQLMADLRMLHEQTQQLQVTVNALTSALTEPLKQVNGKIDDQTGVARKAFADQKLLIDTLTSDVRIIREKQDEANVRISSLSQEFEALRTNMAALTAPPAPAPLPPDDSQLGTPIDTPAP